MANTVEKRHTVHRRVYPCQKREDTYIHTQRHTHIYTYKEREKKIETIYGIEWQALK